VLSERVWLNRGSIPVPEHHRRVPHLLNALAVSGVPLVVWGWPRCGSGRSCWAAWRSSRASSGSWTAWCGCTKT
jgi:hypothetical protein